VSDRLDGRPGHDPNTAASSTTKSAGPRPSPLPIGTCRSSSGNKRDVVFPRGEANRVYQHSSQQP
jgi:hypothetical protein